MSVYDNPEWDEKSKDQIDAQVVPTKTRLPDQNTRVKVDAIYYTAAELDGGVVSVTLPKGVNSDDMRLIRLHFRDGFTMECRVIQ